MLDEKKKWFLLNSGGGAQASTIPSFLWANGWSETRVDAGLVKVGADSYDFQISDDAGFSNIVAETLASVSELTTFTGLTPETDYYVRCRAKFGSVYSDWLSTSCYTLSTPLHAYDFRGIGYDETNEYGKTNSSVQVGEAYSYRGTANTLTPTTATKGAMEWVNLTTSKNIESAYSRFAQNNLYTPASRIDLGTGDFTFLIEWDKNNLGGGLVNFLTDTADAYTFIKYNSGAIQYRFGSPTSGSVYLAYFPSSLTSHSTQKIIGKRVGTSCYAGIMGDDGTVSWGAAVTNANLGLQADFDRFFGAASQSYFSIINFYTKELTDEQIKREFRRAEQPDYTFKSNDDTLMPTGVTWEDLDVDGYFYKDMVAGATGGSSWNGIVTIGNQSCVRLSNRDTLSTDFLKIYNHTNSKVSNDLSVGDIPGQNAEGHNVGSVFLLDNTWYHLEMDNHYGPVPTNILVKRFGDNFNMSEITQLPSGNGIPSHRGSRIQYLNGIKTPTAVMILAHEFYTYAKWLTIYVFTDNFNSCKKIRVTDTGNTNWFYPRVVHMGDGATSAIICHYLDVTDAHYVNSFLILSDDNFQTVRNLGSTWSKTITGNNLPITLAELTTNCLIGTDGTSKTYSRIVLSMFHDPDTSKFYGVETNGDLTGLNFLIDDGAGGWTIRAIDVLGESVEFGYTVKDSVYHGQCVAQMVRTGASSYDLYAFVVVSGTYPNKIYKLVRFRTSDSWVTTDSVVDMTNDDTWCHQSLNITHNLHYSGGSTAYNGKKLLACSRVYYGEPTVYSDVKFIDIS